MLASCCANKVGKNKLKRSKASFIDMSNGQISGRHSSSISAVALMSKKMRAKLIKLTNEICSIFLKETIIIYELTTIINADFIISNEV